MGHESEQDLLVEWMHDDEAYMKLLEDNKFPLNERNQSLMPTPADRKELKEGDSPFHFDSGKARLDQLPPKAIEMVGRVFGYGAKKYGEWNWAQYADDWSDQQLVGSLLRHIFAYQRGENIDPESGHTHLAHAAANAMMLLELVANHKGRDERNPLYKGDR
jgi:hypothetical protein